MTTERMRALNDELSKLEHRTNRILEAIKEEEYISNLSENIPEPGEGSVVRFAKLFNGSRRYLYSAVRTPKGWSVTGRTTMNGISWDRLLKFIISDETAPSTAISSLRMATNWVRLERTDRVARRRMLRDDDPYGMGEPHEDSHLHVPYEDPGF